MSMENDYRHSLDKLAGSSPKTKAALIRSLLPGIEAALQSGQRLKDVLEVLEIDGLRMSYHVFHTTVPRARKVRKPTAASDWRKPNKASEPQPLQDTNRESGEVR